MAGDKGKSVKLQLTDELPKRFRGLKFGIQ
jgi:hypothetical protein